MAPTTGSIYTYIWHPSFSDRVTRRRESPAYPCHWRRCRCDFIGLQRRLTNPSRKDENALFIMVEVVAGYDTGQLSILAFGIAHCDPILDRMNKGQIKEELKRGKE